MLQHECSSSCAQCNTYKFRVSSGLSMRNDITTVYFSKSRNNQMAEAMGRVELTSRVARTKKDSAI